MAGAAGCSGTGWLAGSAAGAGCAAGAADSLALAEACTDSFFGDVLRVVLRLVAFGFFSVGIDSSPLNALVSYVRIYHKLRINATGLARQRSSRTPKNTVL